MKKILVLTLLSSIFLQVQSSAESNGSSDSRSDIRKILDEEHWDQDEKGVFALNDYAFPRYLRDRWDRQSGSWVHTGPKKNIEGVGNEKHAFVNIKKNIENDLKAIGGRPSALSALLKVIPPEFCGVCSAVLPDYNKFVIFDGHFMNIFDANYMKKECALPVGNICQFIISCGYMATLDFDGKVSFWNCIRKKRFLGELDLGFGKKDLSLLQKINFEAKKENFFISVPYRRAQLFNCITCRAIESGFEFPQSYSSNKNYNSVLKLPRGETIELLGLGRVQNGNSMHLLTAGHLCIKDGYYGIIQMIPYQGPQVLRVLPNGELLLHCQRTGVIKIWPTECSVVNRAIDKRVRRTLKIWGEGFFNFLFPSASSKKASELSKISEVDESDDSSEEEVL